MMTVAIMRRYTVLLIVIAASSMTIVVGYPQKLHVLRPEDQEAAADTQHHTDDDSDLYMEPIDPQPQATSSEEPIEGSQTFYPSYNPYNTQPLGHSRPMVYQQEGAYSHRPTPYQQHVGYDSQARFSGYKDSYPTRIAENQAAGLLGSGNFGVIRGGTFYHDNDGDSANYDYDPFYHQNGHGRPSYGFGAAGNPKPRQHQQFENFRDFADINVPSNPAYSQYVIVYANKNTTGEPLPNNKPKNIIEHLQMLDLEQGTTTEAAPPKKLSKYKQKLALSKMLEKKSYQLKKKNPKTTTVSSIDQYEPLLALS